MQKGSARLCTPTTHGADNGTRIDFDAIRRANPLPDYCEANGIRLHRSGSRFIGKCPIHDERNGQSVVIHSDGKWQCYGKCGASGDVIDLERELHGGSIREAAERLGGTLTTNNVRRVDFKRDDAPKPTRENPLALPYVLSAEERAICHQFSLNLLGDDSLIESMAESRGWKYETIRGLALDGYLGRDDDDHTALISEAGCRSRWYDGDGEKQYCVHFGKNWIWRGALIPQAETVYITEGEPDAISLIDDGFEDDGKTATVAIQGASLNLQPWAFLFAGKHVIISPDYDAAGERAAQKNAQILSKVAASVKLLDLRRAA